MASNNDRNSVKHKFNGLDVKFSRTKNNWEVRKGNAFLMDGNFKECKKYAKKV